MRKKTFFGSVALGIAGLALAAPMASASTAKGAIYFDKGVVNQGDTVQVTATCDAPGVRYVQVKSDILEPATLNRASAGTFSGTAKVKANAVPGGYPAGFYCVDSWINTVLIVRDVQDKPSATPKPKPTTSKPATPKPAPAKTKEAQVEVKPKGAADTGEGDVVAAPVQQDSDTGLYVLGGAGLLAAGGAGAFFLRRRSRA
ncbi:hypothetical protein DMH04_39705 [Kibdelosporangium aridum]|uniref:Gram-positive cocci surface proteins LPxTG domain-containing protein n=1 Tax=Kibdelosporangium aridum TaxID=2030 RepID=A0A428YX50_KIBAR|nr:hypothetical protein [Kibdelosporangium aridum]RSM74584.1 hypothetical protein DMH04_39705 [Kibdelosporangium aridum]